ncbi:MAG TPA: hypothetical protein VJS92_05690 [Candidatus Polarisedimenticolaceae bacterium]|nr:hypothetical protein [Candidatus Polarisedimenticolaceae bacterium]
MPRCLSIVLASALLATVAGRPAAAVWSANPAQNLAIADRASDQVIPLVAATPDGGVYVAWFDGFGGSFKVYLQRLNAAGAEQWPHNGVLISSHPQNSALFGWDMIADSQGNAVLVFSDIRSGGDLDIYAYKVSPAGVELWGADGVTLSDNADFEPAPRVVEASDGDFVFVWQRDPTTGDGDIRMQRLAPDGAPRFGLNGIAAVASAGEDPGFALLATADNGSVILAWLRNIRSFSSLRHLRAQKFSPAGAGVWPAFTSVYDAFSLPIGYFPQLQPDAAGGAVLAWHRSDGTLIASFVQHLSASGAELFPHNGVAVSTTAGMHHVDPSLVTVPGSGDALVFWNERNSTQSQWGIFGQRVTAAATRGWGEGGRQLLPVDTTSKSFPHGVPHAGGAMVLLTQQALGSDQLIAMRLDGAGNFVWPGSVVTVSSAPSTKARYPVTIGNAVAKVVWEDNRSGNVDVYAQDVNADGTLGLLPFPGDVGNSLRLGKSAVTPGSLVLSWAASCSNGAVDYAIYEGTLAAFGSHVKLDCMDDGADLREEIVPGAGNRYYLLVPLSATDEGSYGGRPVPAAPDRCLASQALGTCPQ